MENTTAYNLSEVYAYSLNRNDKIMIADTMYEITEIMALLSLPPQYQLYLCNYDTKERTSKTFRERDTVLKVIEIKKTASLNVQQRKKELENNLLSYKSILIRNGDFAQKEVIIKKINEIKAQIAALQVASQQ